MATQKFVQLSPLSTQTEEECFARCVEQEGIGEGLGLEWDSEETEFVIKELNPIDLRQVVKTVYTFIYSIEMEAYRFFEVDVICYQSQDGRYWCDAADTDKFEEF